MAGIVGLGLFCLGTDDCERPKEEPQVTLQKENKEEKTEAGYRVKRVAVFNDDLAYHGKRGIYLITDEATSRTYLGVSGIGITEVGSHSNGNSNVKDER